MKVWHSWHIYYSNLDLLLSKCGKEITGQTSQLDRNFWIRHYAGGAHLRIRVYGEVAAVSSYKSELYGSVLGWMKETPSARDANYSPERAQRLLLLENGSLDGLDLSYRLDEILECEYDREGHGLPSAASLSLLENFYTSSAPLAIRVLLSDKALMTNALRFYYLALIVGTGNLERGAVSAKSHWCGFAAFRLPEEVVSAIENSYRVQREAILAELTDVLAFSEGKSLVTDPLLSDWAELMRRSHSEALDSLKAGDQLCFHINEELAEKQRRHINDADYSRYPFLRTLWGDLGYLASMRDDLHLALPRVITNLCYAFIGPQLGLRAIDKIALCYYAYSSVEEYFSCNLDERLKQNMIASQLRRTRSQMYESSQRASLVCEEG